MFVQLLESSWTWQCVCVCKFDIRANHFFTIFYNVFTYSLMYHNTMILYAYLYIMTGLLFVVAKEEFHHRNGNILPLWEGLNGDEKFFLFRFNYINTHLYLENGFIDLKRTYTDSCNFLNKRALVSQTMRLVVAKESNISHYLNQFIRQWVSFPLCIYNIHPTWLSLTNEHKFDD